MDVDAFIIGGESMAELDANGYLHWKEKMYSESHSGDQDNRFFVDALKSGFIEGKMGARELVFSRNVPPVAKDANT